MLYLRLDQLEDCHLGGIAAADANLHDAGVAAVAVSVLGADLVKQLLCHIFLGDVAVTMARIIALRLSVVLPSFLVPGIPFHSLNYFSYHRLCSA